MLNFVCKGLFVLVFSSRALGGPVQKRALPVLWCGRRSSRMRLVVRAFTSVLGATFRFGAKSTKTPPAGPQTRQRKKLQAKWKANKTKRAPDRKESPPEAADHQSRRPTPFRVWAKASLPRGEREAGPHPMGRCQPRGRGPELWHERAGRKNLSSRIINNDPAQFGA